MSANGVNAVRTYTPPPRWLLDAAQRHGLRIMAGLPVERSVSFLDYRKCARSIEEMVRTEVRARVGHPAILCYTIGNEIPASIVRWHGRRKLERFLERLYYAAKAEDPDSLVSYVNYPSTEYLQLSFLDFACFNVYLESHRCLDAYLARLHNIAGDRPLVMAEMGLDGLRNGEAAQAQVLDWQICTSFVAGCAGVFVYAWTDEWFRGGAEVEDWMFGITARNREPKPALAAVRRAFRQVPFIEEVPWPLVSVVVCSYNGARTIRDCLEGLRKLEYPNCEVIVVDDGSTDCTAAIAREYDCRVIRTENRGLSNARNTGWQAAHGDIVAYIDDDAYPDPHWLHYLAASFLNTMNIAQAAVGGPNIAPASDGAIAECVARSPGGPTHVLLSDREAEHIPGCNMAFRKSCLEAIGGFDPQFRVAGDDVDVCWNLQAHGWTLGFSPAAVVWHHRRNSLRAYWKQQIGYGRAEAILERKWPEKYNGPGHVRWAGRIYGSGLTHALGWRRPRVYHGVWGGAPFQSLYQPAPSLLGSLPQMPEWYLMIASLATIAAFSAVWRPFQLAVPLLAVAIVPPLAQAWLSAMRASFPDMRAAPWPTRVRRRLLTALLHLAQPLARLRGRLKEGLTPWRRRGTPAPAPLCPVTTSIWTEHREEQDQRLRTMEAGLRAEGACVLRGGRHDRWDLEVRGGFFGAARLLLGVEDHPGGCQMLRLRWWPDVPARGPILTLAFALLTRSAWHDHAWVAVGVLGAGALFFFWRTLEQSTAAMATIRDAVTRLRGASAQ